MKKTKQGISLIVLVITIIVMIILAASIIISLNNSGVINRANEAVNTSNEKQVQQLASLIWAEAYMDKVSNIDEKYIKDKLEENGVDTSKYNITVTSNGVTVKSVGERNWTTIYDKGETTTGGEIILANEPMFSIRKDYRFTIAQGEKIWKFETRLIYIEEEGLLAIGALQGNTAIGFSSLEDLESKVETFSDDVVIIMGVVDVLEEQVYSAIGFSDGKEYQIVKVEIDLISGRQEQGTLVAEGFGTLQVNNIYALELNEMIISDKYLLVTDAGTYESRYYNFGGESTIFLLNDELSSMGWMRKNENDQLQLLFGMQGYVELYNLGDDPNTVFEGKYAARKDESGYTLFSAVNSNETTIPETVDGKTITKIEIGDDIGSIAYNREIDVEFVDNIDTICVIADVYVSEGINPSKLFDALIAYDGKDIWTLTIDLTKLDDVIIPDEVLSMTDPNICIYVTETVKAKYSDSSMVQAR